MPLSLATQAGPLVTRGVLVANATLFLVFLLKERLNRFMGNNHYGLQKGSSSLAVGSTHTPGSTVVDQKNDVRFPDAYFDIWSRLGSLYFPNLRIPMLIDDTVKHLFS
jgi:hypothetical protein